MEREGLEFAVTEPRADLESAPSVPERLVEVPEPLEGDDAPKALEMPLLNAVGLVG